MANADDRDVQLPETQDDVKARDQAASGSPSNPSVTGEGIGSAQNQTAAGGAAVEKDESGQSTTRG